jgi:hypothetical protein
MFDLGLTGLNCVYFALVAVGFMYALIILISGGLHSVDLGHLDFDVGGDIGDIHVPDMHVDLDHSFGLGDFDHGAVHVPSLSPITIASFVTAFGAFGILSTLLFDAPGNWSLLWAALGGLVIGAITHFAYFYLLIKPQGSSEVTTKDIIGATAEVITPIPEGKVGEVAFVAQRGRVAYTAQSVGGQPISKGTIVTIKDMVGSVVRVAPKDVE